MDDKQLRVGDLLVEERYEEALEILNPEVSCGTAWAEGSLAFLYHHGFGVPRDLSKTEELLRSSAEKGDGTSAHNLGTLMVELAMNGLPHDDPKEWYRKAKELGCQYAIDEFYE